MQEGKIVPERPASTGPALWIVRNDSSARRLRLQDGELRTVIGFETIVSQRVERIALADVDRVDVLAPYASPTPKLPLIIFGMALGMMLGSQFQPGAAIVIAATAITFAAVAQIVGGMTPASRRIARLKMKGGGDYAVTYRHEDEEDVRRLFGQAQWNDSNVTAMDAPLLPTEVTHAERMRFGTLLAAGACGLIVLMLSITEDSGVSEAVAIPVNILYLAVLGFTLIFSGISWYKLTRAGVRRPGR